MEHSTKFTLTPPFNQERTHTAHSALRLVAPPAIFAVETYAGRHPAVAVQAENVTGISKAFILAYDKSRTKSPDAAQQTQELVDSTRVVQTNMQAWMGALVTAAPQIDLSSFANASRTPAGIIADARRLIELVGKHVQAGEPIRFAAEMIEELQAAVDSAEKELNDVLALQAEHAELEQRVRTLGIQLNAALVGLRRTLRAVLGPKHPHYRALLIRRRNSNGVVELVEDDDPDVETAEPANTADTPAAPTDGEEMDKAG